MHIAFAFLAIAYLLSYQGNVMVMGSRVSNNNVYHSCMKMRRLSTSSERPQKCGRLVLGVTPSYTEPDTRAQ